MNICAAQHQSLADVNGSHSFRPPCHYTVSAPRSHHHRSRASWWRRACRARSTASQCPWPALGHWWWTGRWRGWSASCSDPEGRGRSLCSGKRCSPGGTRSSLTSQSPRSQRRGAGAGREKTHPLPHWSPQSGHCGRMDLTWGPEAGWKWLWYRLDLVKERSVLWESTVFYTICSMSQSSWAMLWVNWNKEGLSKGTICGPYFV